MTAVTSQPVRGSRFPTLEKYDVLEELGHGGMATVYRAHDQRLGRDVAIKVIHPHLRDSAEAVRRFAIEARAVAKLRHANIVEVYDVSASTETEQYLVVELLRGVTLRKLLETHGHLPAEVAASIGVELLAALAHAHEEGVVHRDVKPENVILEHRPLAVSATKLAASNPSGSKEDPSSTPATPSLVPPATSTPVPSGQVVSAPAPGSRPSDTPGDRISIKLTDFGIAKLLDGQGVTSTGQVLGSPAHMAPEQIEGRDVDGRADVFAIGVLLYESMVGHLPFTGQNPAQVLRRVLEGEYPNAENERPTVGRAWSTILDRALAGDLSARFASASEMREALVRELARMGVTSPRGEIEAWLDDPPSYAATHVATMPARLSARGDEASRRRDALAAAADYNRALAFAPNDAALMKLVLRVNRRNARRDVARRVWPYGLLGLCLLSAGIALKVELSARARTREAQLEVPMTLPSVGPSTDEVVPPLSATSVSLPEAAGSARTIAHPVVSARPRPTSREVLFPTVEPEFGVQVSVDGAPAVDLAQGKSLTLDLQAHSLKLFCKGDLCDSQTRRVEAGDRPASFAVHLTVLPCKVTIRGVPGHTYGLNDSAHPLMAGELPNSVAMKTSQQPASVVELDTGRRRPLLLQAGKAVAVEFAPIEP